MRHGHRTGKQATCCPSEREDVPALLDSTQWAKWLGEEPASMDKLKSYLKTVEGRNWKLRRERPDVTTVGVADDPTLH